MQQSKKSAAINVFALSASLAAGAAQADVGPVLVAGWDFGGDTMAGLVLSDGDTIDIDANEGFYVGGGISVINAAKTVEGRVTIAWKFSAATATNQDITWVRYPVDALLFFRSSKLRLGAGLTYHLNPELEFDGDLANGTVAFDDTMGFLAQVDYMPAEKLAVGLRYTSIDYEINGVKLFSGDGLGLTFSVAF